MAEIGSLESFQALYNNLCALPEQQFSNLDRLGAELDAHVEYFRNLLDKKAKDGASRQALSSGKLEIFGQEYELNKEFQEDCIQLAEDLDLDELEAAKLLIAVQDDRNVSERPILTEAVIRFHQTRKYTLDCLLTVLQLSTDTVVDDVVQDGLRSLVHSQIVEPLRQGPGFVAKCLTSMSAVRAGIQRLAQKSNTVSVTGQASQSELLERLEFERVSFVKQHESLGAIAYFLVKEDQFKQSDFDAVLQSLQNLDKYDHLLVHYIPILSAFISYYGTLGNGAVSLAEARQLSSKILDSKSWTLSYVHAAVRVMWIAEYSSCYGENHDGTMSEDVLDKEMKSLSGEFSKGLTEGAFDFLLSISADVKSAEWCDPARQGLRQWLQRKAPVVLPDTISFSVLFQDVLMEQVETFVESFITNIPDVLRKLRTDEDQQRQLSKEHEHDLDLERFIVIISYAFENRPKAAHEGFWASKDSALYGFMQWASRRASTPLVSAFCEMLQALASGEENATAAHEFLLDESSQSTGKMRRSHALTWNQIFSELTFFSGKLRGNTNTPQSQTYRPGKTQSDLVEAEPESTLMLECYLRLITRLCMECAASRQFLFYHSTFNLVDLLFNLVSSPIEPRLRACAFTTIRSLLTKKSQETGEHLWTTLEYWASGNYANGSALAKASPATLPTTSMQTILNGITGGFEEPNSFVELLKALVQPYDKEAGLRDVLPFPEQLGAATRMPGIEPYVDFVVGQIFAARFSQEGEMDKVRLLQLSCLDFIATCLDTFNENLVVFATEISLSIDLAISSSNLQNYVLLHPFSRVMEWIYDERVLKGIFECIHQDPIMISTIQPDSPLLLCILRSIQIITKVIELQPTYLEIVRPIILSRERSGRTPVELSSSRFPNVEDAVLTHLALFADLGLLCGTGQPELVVAALKLLRLLAASPRFTGPSSGTLGKRGGRSRILAAIEDDADNISNIMLREINEELDPNQNSNSAGYITKVGILDFLIANLKASSTQPSVAHRLLGFHCGRDGLSIARDSFFEEGSSLFHAVLAMAVGSPMEEGSGPQSWLVTLNYKCQQVLKELWSSPISSAITMAELSNSDTLASLLSQEFVVDPRVLWDGHSVLDPTFLLEPSASCYGQYLSRRTLILQYAAAELRYISKTHSPSQKQQIIASLLGSSMAENGQQVDHPSVFDLFDFMEPELISIEPPSLEAFRSLNFRVCQNQTTEDVEIYNLDMVEELLILHRAEIINTGKVQTEPDLQTVNSAAQSIMEHYAIANRVKLLYASRVNVLNAWVQLQLIIINNADFDATSKTSFIVRTLQLIMPILESGFDNTPLITELAKLAKALVFSLDFDVTLQQGDLGELISDRLLNLFQVSLRAITLLGAQSSLKEFFYNISYHYLTRMTSLTISGASRKKHSIQTIKSVGDRFVDVLCDDAHAGTPTCRIAALLLLGALVKLGKAERSSYILEALTRLNFIGILVDGLRFVPEELRSTSAEDVDIQLSYYHAKLTLLLELAQTRAGSSAVLSSGLFHFIRESGLFTIDADLGVDIDGPDAVTKHYDLLSAILRVICAALLSRGSQNELSLDQGRRFLMDNRLSTMSILKKSAGLELGTSASENSILELAECYMILINVTGFLDSDEDTTKKKQSLRTFT